MKLFLNDSKDEVLEITEQLNEYNRERQETEKRIFDEVIEKIETEKLNDKNAIVLAGHGWHHGVIGIVASKVTDLYFKPTILICLDEGKGKGSGRSVPGFDLHDALCKCSEYLDKYGGHEMAVGLSLDEKNVEAFAEKFEEISSQARTSEIVSVIKIDKELKVKDIDIEKIKELSKLEPVGESNKMPIFIYKNLKINSIRALSEGKHMKLTLKDGNTIINAIGFNLGSVSSDYLIGDKVDVVGVLEINTFNGLDTIQINLRDIRKSY